MGGGGAGEVQKKKFAQGKIKWKKNLHATKPTQELKMPIPRKKYSS